MSSGATINVQDIDGSGTWLHADVPGIGEAWCSAKYLLPQADHAAFPWLAVAAAEIGIRNYPGDAAHPRIQQYLASVDNLNDLEKSSDETAWCSAFINWCVEKCKINGTNSAWAKNWHNWRNRINGKQSTGAIAVFERITSKANAGHVGIYITQVDDQVLLLGGNQSRSVRYSRYPITGMKGDTRYQLLSLRGL